MAITLATVARNAAADAVVDLLDDGAGDNSGDIALATSDGTIVCVCNLSDPAFGPASNGVATANAISQGTVSGSDNPSTIATAVFRNKANVEIFRCAVGTSGSDINLSSVIVNDNDTIAIDSLTYAQPASSEPVSPGLPTYTPTRFVSADATGSGDGLSREGPWTVEQAISEGAGQVVEFAPGIYTRPNPDPHQKFFPAFPAPQGTEQNPTIWFARYRTSGTAYEVGVTSELRNGITSGEGNPTIGGFQQSDIVYDGFFINQSNGAMSDSDSGIAAIWACNRVRIRSCVIIAGLKGGLTDGNNYSCIRMEGCDHCEISDCYLYGAASKLDDEFSLNGSNIMAYENTDCLVQYNEIRGAVCGFFIKTNEYQVQYGYTIRNNRFIDNQLGLHVTGTSATAANRIYQNIFAGNTVGYAGVHHNAVKLVNNLFYMNSYGAVEHLLTSGDQAGNEAMNNLLVGPGGGHYSWYNETTPAMVTQNWPVWDRTWYYSIAPFGVEVLSGLSYADWQSTYGKDLNGMNGTDPLLANPNAGDYRLQDVGQGIGSGTSPALGQGIDLLNLLGGGTSAPINVGPFISTAQDEVIGRRIA